jgi:hypothetical protein
LNRVRSIKYTNRTLSYYKVKKAKLEKLARGAERERLLKLGKIQLNTRR